MDNLDNLKAIWHSANTDILPSANEMVHIVSKFRRQKIRNKWMMIIFSFLLSALMIIVLCMTDFKLWTTYLGGGLIAASSIFLAADNLQSLRRFYQLEDGNNQEFLAFIAQTRKNQIRYYKKTQLIIMLICASGLVLYFYELTEKNMLWFFAGCALSLAYLLFMWFVVRKRNFRRDGERLNATSREIEEMLKQK